MRRGVAAGPSNVSHTRMRRSCSCPQGGAVFGGSFLLMWFCFQNVVFSCCIRNDSPQRSRGRCSKSYENIRVWKVNQHLYVGNQKKSKNLQGAAKPEPTFSELLQRPYGIVGEDSFTPLRKYGRSHQGWTPRRAGCKLEQRRARTARS